MGPRGGVGRELGVRFRGGVSVNEQVPAIEAWKPTPAGLKPRLILHAYAALKRRASTACLRLRWGPGLRPADSREPALSRVEGAAVPT
jgi:hypothetical protein